MAGVITAGLRAHPRCCRAKIGVGSACTRLAAGVWAWAPPPFVRPDSVLASELKSKKSIIEHKGGLWRVMKSQHVKTGARGSAYMQLDLKDVVQGTRITQRFRSSEKVERVSLESSQYQFLYRDGNTLVVMDGDTYEQVEVAADLLTFEEAYLDDGVLVRIESHNGTPLSVSLAESNVVCEVASVEALRGDTINNKMVGCELTNGRRVMVPSFVQSGDRIEIKVEDESYVKRV